MFDKPREECGVLGIYSSQVDNVALLIQPALEAENHRGQESWGVVTNRSKTPYKRMGLVLEKHLYKEDMESIEAMKGNAGIGHVRYSTTGSSTIDNAHPILIKNRGEDFFVAMNGTLENFDFLSQKVGSNGYQVRNGCTDAEIFGLRLSQILSHKTDFIDAFCQTAKEINGSYSLVFLKGDKIYAARDPMGFRPLCIGYEKETDSHVVASESVALYRLGAELVRDVNPGELITIDESGVNSLRFSELTAIAHCLFEYTYFAHPSSVIDGINVYTARKNVGRGLGSKFPIDDAEVVIPVPDSARPAASGYHEITGVTLEEGLIKDKYNKKANPRSFIEPDEKERIETVKSITAIKPVVDDKNIVVIDDSIVRGTSSRHVVNALKKAGAKKVTLVIEFPPIRYPCYMGIDFPTQEELVAYLVAKDTNDSAEIGERVAKEIGADAVYYNDVLSLRAQIGLSSFQSCNACNTGDYSCLSRPPKFRTREEMKGRI